MGWILIGIDGSTRDDTVIGVVRSIHWPAATTFGVVTAVPAHLAFDASVRAPILDVARRDADAARFAHLQQSGWAAVDSLRAAGYRALCRIIRGRPADVLIRLAHRYEPDLIVVGSRGVGTLEGALFGSVSAEVLDGARCPVLIARTELRGTTVIADDGSSEAEAAISFVDERPYLLGDRVRLVGVHHVEPIWPELLVPLDPGTAQRLVETDAEARGEMIDHLSTDARRESVRLDTTPELRNGNPAAGIIAAAVERNAGLIVVGTAGNHGLLRLAIGSVSRDVVRRAPCSVLVVPRSRPDAVDLVSPLATARMLGLGATVAPSQSA
jgi:nucleotide-binding universal stress UspA family protein